MRRTEPSGHVYMDKAMRGVQGDACRTVPSGLCEVCRSV